MWAIARREHGLTFQEFQEITLVQFEALEERRDVEIRHARFNAALITSTIYNAHRSADAEALEVWDFVPGLEKTAEERQRESFRKEMKRLVSRTLNRVATESPERVKAVTERLIARLTENGIEDPKDLIREIFPEMEL